MAGLHADFACLLYSKLEHKLPDDIVEDMIKGAVEVERDFICGALPCDLIGMNKAHGERRFAVDAQPCAPPVCTRVPAKTLSIASKLVGHAQFVYPDSAFYSGVFPFLCEVCTFVNILIG